MKIWPRNSRLYLLALTLLLLFVSCSCSPQAKEESFHCFICDGLPYHAPCVVNLSTGRVLELSVYDNDPAKQGELAGNQTKGHFEFIGGDGMVAMKDAGYSCSINTPSDSAEMNPALFCDVCLEALSQVQNNGIVLADLYDLQDPHFYAIETAAEHSFRCYDIQIVTQENGQHHITVTGTLS